MIGKRHAYRIVTVLAAAALILAGCKITYSFSGTSIQPDVKTICIEQVVNKATKGNPPLANQITESLNDKFKRLTKLSTVEEDGDHDRRQQRYDHIAHSRGDIGKHAYTFRVKTVVVANKN